MSEVTNAQWPPRTRQARRQRERHQTPLHRRRTDRRPQLSLSPRLPICNEGRAPDFAKTVKPSAPWFHFRVQRAWPSAVAKTKARQDDTTLARSGLAGVEPRGPKVAQSDCEGDNIECQEILTDMTDNECWMIIAGK
jgi:hypothetical protein